MDVFRLGAVIFDVDGTLVDSERDGHRLAFNRAFAEMGLPHRWDVATYGRLLEITGGEQRLRHYLERGPADQGGSSGSEALAGQLHQLKTRYFTEMVTDARIPARPGVIRLLDELSGNGIPIGVATTGSGVWVRPLLERLFGTDRFATVITSAEVAARKPDPAAYHRAMDVLGIGPRGAIAVEDSGPGFRSARAAGLRCVVVANDYTRLGDVADAEVVVEGFGTQTAPARTVADPLGVMVSGLVDAESLHRLAVR